MARYDDKKIIEMLREYKIFTWNFYANKLTEITNASEPYNPDALRNYCYTKDWYNEFRRANGSHTQLAKAMHNTPENTMTSEIVIERSEGRLFTEEELLKIHGFNPIEWTVVNAKSNEWSTSGDNPFWNYQSKISVKPRTAMDLKPQQIIDQFKDIQAKTFEYKLSDKQVSDYLLIPLSDMHIGLNTYEDYQKLQSDIIHIIRNGYKEILFLQLGDFYHVDNMNGTTVNLTQVTNGLKFNFKRMIEDGRKFIEPLLKEALEHARTVKYVYSKGNHASSPDFIFANNLKYQYPQVEVDDEIQEFKCTMLGKNAILQHHSDKVKAFNKLVSVFYSNYGYEMGTAKNRYLFTGHFHHEKSLSDAGITHYQVQSPSKHTSYEKDYGFNTSESGQMVFVFDEDKRKGIYYL